MYSDYFLIVTYLRLLALDYANRYLKLNKWSSIAAYSLLCSTGLNEL